MHIRRRQATERELARKYEGLSWFQRKRRALARAEASIGEIEEISFRVRRAWKLFSCSGAPCCPNEWLLEADSGEFVQVDSWESLAQTEEERFPGCDVTVRRWPQSLRVMGAETHGSPVETAELTDGVVDLADQRLQCRICALSELPENVRRLVSVP